MGGKWGSIKRKKGKEVVPVKGGMITGKGFKNVTTQPKTIEAPESPGEEGSCAVQNGLQN